MAHFAKIGLNNEVLDVVVVNNIDCMTPGGVHDETIGVAFLKRLTGHETWVQTSYTGEIRMRFAGVGYQYDSASDEFVPPDWAFDQELG
jgi:hypothetical protein